MAESLFFIACGWRLPDPPAMGEPEAVSGRGAR